MQMMRENKSLEAVRERERALYFNEEKCSIVLYAEKSIEENIINSINKTKPIKII